MKNKRLEVKSERRKSRYIVVGIIVVLAVILYLSRKEVEDWGLKFLGKRQDAASLVAIAGLKTEPQKPTSSGYIRVIPVLENPEVGGVKFHYRWFVNDRYVPEVDHKMLDSEYFRKGDQVYCMVRAVKGRLESREIGTDKIVIANSPPVINYSPVGLLTIPGYFRYQIDAHDPDGDPLEYRLVAPLDREITVDPGTGGIEWYIEELPGKKEPEESFYTTDEEGGSFESEEGNEALDQENGAAAESPVVSPLVTIVFEVRDGDNGKAKASIRLDLRKGKEAFE